VNAVRGRLVWDDGGDQHPPVLLSLSGKNLARSMTVRSDTFRIADVPAGAYVIQTALLGQRPRIDSITVPPEGIALSIPFTRTIIYDACGNGVTVVREKPWWKFW
jgi:hypothetical protein